MGLSSKFSTFLIFRTELAGERCELCLSGHFALKTLQKILIFQFSRRNGERIVGGGVCVGGLTHLAYKLLGKVSERGIWRSMAGGQNRSED